MTRLKIIIGIYGILYSFSLWYVYRHWGAVGAVILFSAVIAFFSLFYLYSYRLITSSEKKMTAIFDGMSDKEMLDVLESSDAVTKKEVLIYMEKHPEKYCYVLEHMRAKPKN